MSQVRRMGIAAALIAVLAAAVAGCGSSGGSSGVIIRGTTDEPVSYDPAGAYDLPSYDVIYAIYQNLMTIPAGRVDARARGGSEMRVHGQQQPDVPVHAQGLTSSSPTAPR